MVISNNSGAFSLKFHFLGMYVSNFVLAFGVVSNFNGPRVAVFFKMYQQFENPLVYFENTCFMCLTLSTLHGRIRPCKKHWSLNEFFVFSFFLYISDFGGPYIIRKRTIRAIQYTKLFWMYRSRKKVIDIFVTSMFTIF